MNASHYWLRVKAVLYEKNRNLNWLSKETEFPLNTIHGWISKGVLPQVDRAVIIANVLNTTVEDLIGGHPKAEPPEVIKLYNSPATMRIVSRLIPLNEQQIESVEIGVVAALGSLGLDKQNEHSANAG